jgi:hypothetical protein
MAVNWAVVNADGAAGVAAVFVDADDVVESLLLRDCT